MNLRELAKYFGYSENYFYVVRAMNREKFDFIFSFDSDIKKSAEKYCDYVTDLLTSAEEMYYSDIEEFENKMVHIGYVPAVKSKKTKAIHFSKNFYKIRDKSPLSMKFNLVQNLIFICEDSVRVA